MTIIYEPEVQIDKLLIFYVDILISLFFVFFSLDFSFLIQMEEHFYKVWL
jgi:hypothetical protein